MFFDFTKFFFVKVEFFPYSLLVT